TVYELEKSDIQRLAGHALPPYELVQLRAVVDESDRLVHVLTPPSVPSFEEPVDAYVACIRDGLSYLYPIRQVDQYLKAAIRRERIFVHMQGQWLAEAVTNVEYGIEFRRLFPWRGTINTPWGAAWGKIRPGQSSELYVHDEEETAIVVSGCGEVRVDS